jgi:hypothetical protein
MRYTGRKCIRMIIKSYLIVPCVNGVRWGIRGSVYGIEECATGGSDQCNFSFKTYFSIDVCVFSISCLVVKYFFKSEGQRRNLLTLPEAAS